MKKTSKCKKDGKEKSRKLWFLDRRWTRVCATDTSWYYKSGVMTVVVRAKYDYVVTTELYRRRGVNVSYTTGRGKTERSALKSLRNNLLGFIEDTTGMECGIATDEPRWE